MILHKGETLFRQGESGPLFHVKSGMLKIERVHQDGNALLVNLIVPGETIPHHSLITPKPYFGTAVALVTSEIQVYRPDEWYGALEEDPVRYCSIALQSKLSPLNVYASFSGGSSSIFHPLVSRTS